MAEIMTRISSPSESYKGGIADYGRKTKEEMIAMMRSFYLHQLEEAKRILSVEDNQFEIEVVRGKIVGNHVEWIQNPRGIERKKK